MAIKDYVGNAAEISILEPIDNNYKTGGGDVSVAGAIVKATKGKPFTPLPIYGGTTDIQDTFGLPLPKKSTYMEGLRHVHDASEECTYVNVVRVVDSLTYRFPSIAFLLFNDTGEEWAVNKEYKTGDIVTVDGVKYICAYDNTSTPFNHPTYTGQEDWLEYTGPTESGAHRYNEDVVVGDGAFMVIYVVDGDESTNRYFKISDIDPENERFKLTFYDLDELGEEYTLESHLVAVGEDDKDDMGMSSYIETVFERDSDCFRVDYMESVTWDQILPVLQALATTRVKTNYFAFTGGKTGDDPETSDWQLGVNVFRNERVKCNLLFAAGIYDMDIIASLAGVADDRHISFFYDIPPSLKADQAMTWDADLGLTSRHARCYYSPYSANDQWRGGKCVWGVSGAMAAAKARCNKTINAGVTPGCHYSPAGEARSYLNRTGIEFLFPDDIINREDFYEARINPMLPITSGGVGADDDLVHWFKTNYIRFGWINDVLDYIDHRFIEAARQAKFEPDGLTRAILLDLTTQILEDLVTSGALVAPRYPDRDGTKPYIIHIKQEEIDLWKVTWEVCITGAARRIVGQPSLIK